MFSPVLLLLHGDLYHVDKDEMFQQYTSGYIVPYSGETLARFLIWRIGDFT